MVLELLMENACCILLTEVSMYKYCGWNLFTFLVVWISVLSCFIFSSVDFFFFGMASVDLYCFIVFRYFRHASGSLVILSKNLAQYININRLVLNVLFAQGGSVCNNLCN